MISMDVVKNPGLRFRIDNFTVPDAAREPFETAMRRNFAFIQTLPGFQGHMVFEKTGGPGSFNIATIAVWESQDAIDKAVAEVGAFYKKNGIDMPAMLKRYGIKAELGQFSALPLKE
ncbi:antibiotic biosynthesis monooxygenase [Corallococcus llansteffanensis]|uniref:Antibiotic biosynthesis monooxygenase n=2 Tax=Corallococcus llansteffanensis TaxID=2316731 RepID=A0A3A8QI63_9BACT|nr:antibiotic biosynthesis monooxygenase [Corallococcus llansteffanensis]